MNPPRTEYAAVPLTKWRELPEGSTLLLVDANVCRGLEMELIQERARLRYLSELWMPASNMADPIAKWMKIGDHNRMCDALDDAIARELATPEQA